ncbi:hypothetical protein L2E82_21279 [Cichorium intybus]|uniref:Uncharacterized protein n=1 Tax=Cichorium intybus TaxID=13427 RepID=A0ACB9DVU7_CICIN|nr:hypothetical protein L2E82_21279 [Cichorium intybus]
MASTDYQGSSSPSFIRFGRSILSMKRDPAIHETTSQEQAVEDFQRHVAQRFMDLSQDRGIQSNINIPKNFNWGAPIIALHERILEESKKRGRRNACGLLKEIEGIERSACFVNELCDSLKFPLTEEQEAEVRKRVDGVEIVYESIKTGLDPLEKQVRDVFHRIVRSRTQGLDRRSY